MDKNRGFTLVEMSIVLVIISMIVAGIVGGSYLLGQYQLKVIISEANYYNTAMNGFNYQYGQLPGDFNAASTVWPTCYTTPSNCNGNNNGMIDGATANQYADENLHAWQHLYLAGFIEQKMSGYHNIAGRNTIGTNVPASKISGAGWVIERFVPQDTVLYNVLIIGKGTTSVNNSPFLTPMQSQTIDKKIDDGRPMTGRVRGAWSDAIGLNYVGYAVNTGCAISATNIYNNLTAYKYTKICTMSFPLDFN